VGGISYTRKFTVPLVALSKQCRAVNKSFWLQIFFGSAWNRTRVG